MTDHIFPAELCNRKQWLVWRFEDNELGSKPRKMPYYVGGKRRTGKQGSDDDRASLATYDDASAFAAANRYDGLGFAFLPDDGLIGIDLDGCFETDDTERHERAVKIIKACDSFTELSPSGRGVHIIVSGTTETFKSNEKGIEVFCGRQFFTMTGKLRAGSPMAINPISDDVLTKLRKTVKGTAPIPKPKPNRPVFRDGEPASVAKIESALAFINPSCGYEDWIKVGMAIHSELGESGFGVWDYWSGRAENYPGDRELMTHWRSFNAGSITIGTLFKMATDAGWRPPRPMQAPPMPVKAPVGRVDMDTGEIIADDPSQPATSPIRERTLIYIIPDAPYDVAKQFIDDQHMTGTMETLHYWRGDWYLWNGIHYQQVNEDRIKSELYEWLANTLQYVKEMPEPVKPNIKLVAEVYNALKAIRLIQVDEPPTWIKPPADGCPASDIIPCWNGFLRISTRRLEPARPELFVTASLEFDARENPPAPVEWLKFIDQIWSGDTETQNALAESIGYMLTDATDQQKMFLLCGVKRSGKGTILRTINSLVGRHNTVSPSMSSLGTQFGLQPLIGKRVAMISDARLSHKADQAAITENMLRISGEDTVSIERKYKETWSGKLPTKFLLASNEPPQFNDASAAISSRMIIFQFTRSFYGQEDFGLTDRLAAELPGILMWALDGLERMRSRGRLIQPKSGQNLASEMEEMTSPISQFIEDRCIVDMMFEIETGELYQAWREWCEQEGREHPGSKATFGKMLRAAASSVTTSQQRRAGRVTRLYDGIRLRTVSDL